MKGTLMPSHYRACAPAAASIAAAGICWLFVMGAQAQTPPTRALPTFEVDPSWPKMPAKWKLGDASSIAFDAQDNVFVLHRPRTLPPEQPALGGPPGRGFRSEEHTA